jgi:type I restriction enzyme M protein
MLDTLTKRRIDTARDILVGKLPDPKSQVEQITIALIYKFMDDMDKQAEELGGKTKFFTGEYEKYSWSKIFDPRVSGYELVGLYGEAIQKMNHNPNIPPLFRNIFKNAYLPYRDPETLKMFLKVIGEFEYDYSEKLGDAFEYLLSIMGSQGDAGQFRTPRHIIDFMVKVVDPSKNETILDPACGTAGFLISSFNHIQNKNKKDGRINLTSDERARLVENLSGYDISPDMVRLSLVNMYLHGFQSPKIYEYDTLASEEKWNEFYDIILANPPFMSPKGGIKPHKRFSVQANRSEVLFVDYIEEHLNPNGRAGVIVPEGIIFQSGIAYKKLRKMLIENSLYAVVSLPAGVFNPYSGVKTSILFLNKNLAKKTDKILFVKVNNDGFGLGAQRREIKENDLPMALEIINKYKQSIIEGKEIEFDLDETKIAHMVKKEKIAESGDYNLSGDRYRQAVTYNGKWDFVELLEIADIGSGNSAPQGEKYFKNGKYPFYRTSDVGKVHISTNLIQSNDYVNELAVKEKKLHLFPKDTILFPKSGASTFLNHRVMISKEGYVSSHLATIVPNEKKIYPLFLFYLLLKIDAKTLTPDQAYPSLKISKIQKIKIPLPPLEIQEQIVAELDSYQKIIDGAKQVVENYKPTFKVDPEWEIIELDKICKLEYGYSEPAKNNGEYRYIRITDISEDGLLKYDEIKYVNLNEKSKKYILKNGDVLVARTGATYGKTLYFDEEIKAIFAGYLIRLNFRKEQINSKFYWIFSQSLNYGKQKNELVQGGGQPQFNANTIKYIKIPLPSLEIQKKIVFKIENEQKNINANKELITIFENKIKDKIAEVWGE